MRALGGFALFVALALLAPLPVRAGTLESRGVVADFDESGRLLHLRAQDGDSLFLRPAVLRVTDSLTGKAALASSASSAQNVEDARLTVSRRLPSLDLTLEEVFELDGVLRWMVRLQNPTDRRREVALEFVFKLDGRDALPFFGAGNSHPGWPDRGKLAYGYYRWDEGVRWGLPVACLYSPERDLGLSLCPELSGHIRPISCLMEREGNNVTVRVHRRFIRIEPNAFAESVLYLAVHPGDWRSSLSWVRDRWKDLFFVPFPDVERLHYPACGGNAPFCARENAAPYVAEVQYAKWYGEDIPEEEEWYSRVGDLWWKMKEDNYAGLPDESVGYLEIQRWLVENGVPEKYLGTMAPQVFGFDLHKGPWRISRNLVNDYMDYLHERKFVTCWYFCPMEAWGAYMKKRWPDGLVYGPQQFFPPTPPDERSLRMSQYYSWGSYVTNPDPDTPFGSHLVKQIENLFAFYPGVDGVYIDQPFHCELDFSRDDGLSVVQGRPVSNTGYTFDRLMEKVRALAHSRGKFIWCNIPVRIGDARWMDVMQQESSSPRSIEEQKFFSLGDRISLTLFPFSPVTSLDGTTSSEYFDQVALAAGFIERLHMNPKGQKLALADLAEGKRYPSHTFQYLFAMLRGRSWVLEPHCLELPEGCFGNIFCTKKGNLLVPVILRDTLSTTPYSRYDLPVTVRVADAPKVRAVYLLSPEHLGAKKLPFRREGTGISVSVPRQRSISMLLLATTGRYVAVDAFSILRGAAEVPLVLENWTEAPWHLAGELAGFVSGRLDSVVGPGASEPLVLPCDWSKAPATDNGLRFFALETDSPPDIPEVRLPGDDPTIPFEVPVDGPITLDFAPPSSLKVGRRTELLLTLGNNTPEPLTLALRCDMPDVRRPTVDLSPGARRQVALPFVPSRPGEHTLTVTAETGNVSASVGRSLVVERAGLADRDFAHVSSAWVLLDTFSQDMGGAQPWTLFVNGVEAAKIQPDSAGEHHGMWRSQAPSSGRFELNQTAVRALKRANEIRISNPNRSASPYPVAYGFKVRDLSLHLDLADGTTLSASADGPVVTSNGDWLYAEGERLPLGKDLVWKLPVPIGPPSEIPDRGKNLALSARAIDLGSLFAGNVGTLGTSDPGGVGPAAANDGNPGTRVVAASGYHGYALVFDEPVSFNTIVLKEYESRIQAVEVKLGDTPEAAELIHPSADVRYNWYQAPFGNKVGSEIVLNVGPRSARRVEILLYREQSASVPPPSVREIELYHTGAAGR
ncbi:MAG: hypothetical protein V2A58_06480 [Planctomycetota bacterium]